MMVNKYISSMADSMIKRSDQPSYDVWPAPEANITLANDITGKTLIDYLKKIFLNNSVESLCNAFEYPSKITNYMYLFLLQPENKKDAIERRKTATKMLKVIKQLRSNDTFLKGQNIVKNFSGKVKNIYLYLINEKSINYIRRIIAMLTIINEYNYIAWTSIGREIHGMYSTKNDSILLREFNNLKVNYWGYSKYLPWNKVSIYTNDSESPSYDFFGRVYYKSLSRNQFNKCCIELDEKVLEVTENNLKYVYDKLFECLKYAKEEVSKKSGNELLLQYGKGQYYCLNQVAKKLDLNLEIIMSNEIEEKILNVKSNSSFDSIGKLLAFQKNNQERKKILKKFINPSELNKY